jgi:hypothetical protein
VPQLSSSDTIRTISTSRCKKMSNEFRNSLISQGHRGTAFRLCSADLNPIHSLLSAFIGSIDAARIAGTQPATSAETTSSPAAALKTAGS